MTSDSGLAVIRAALLVRAKKGHLANLARDNDDIGRRSYVLSAEEARAQGPATRATWSAVLVEALRYRATSADRYLLRSLWQDRQHDCSARKLIERFNKIKQSRRVATRYDKLAANHLAFINLINMHLAAC